MERVWIFVACLCALAAAVLLWRGNVDMAFVTGVLGLLDWFLSLRSRLITANPLEDKASKFENNAIGDQDED
jgi:hypothetical protein